MRFPIIELVDRYTIALVKAEKTNNANAPEVEFYRTQMVELDVHLVATELINLTELHRQIWALEDDFKKYRDSDYSLAEIGRRALFIRDLNQHRVNLKNRIAEILGCSVREIKRDHCSDAGTPCG